MSQRYEADPNAGHRAGRLTINRRGLMLGLGGIALGGAFVGDWLRVEPVATVVRSTPLYGLATPRILGCDEWKARKASPPVSVLDHPAYKIIVHHTAPANPRSEDVPLDALARGIQNDHMNRRGWQDSGHHFLINRIGQIAEGRHRSEEALLNGQHMIDGAHCRNQNDKAIGIENQGNYMKDTPPAAMLATLKTMCAFICARYGIDPSDIFGHRDFDDTQCCGDRLYALLPSLRSGVASLLQRNPSALPLNAVAWPLLQFNDRGPNVLAMQHLMRNAGVAGVPADGVFGATTSVGLLAFQQAHGIDQTGVIAGGSWPLLAVPVRRGQGGEGEKAVQALLAARSGQAWQESLPDTVQGVTWQTLLAMG